MDRFVPYEKLSKKKKRQLDAEKRGSWYGLTPITRKPKNPKAYDRKKARCWNYDSSNVLVFSFSFFIFVLGLSASVFCLRAQYSIDTITEVSQRRKKTRPGHKSSAFNKKIVDCNG